LIDSSAKRVEQIMRIELANNLEEIVSVVAAVEAFADGEGLDEVVRQAAELSVDELLTNTISYGYPDAEEHNISLELNVDGDVLRLVISDDAIAFNPFEQKGPNPNLSIDEQKSGGFGIHLVKEFMDDYAYQRLAGRNVVTLVKTLGDS
jgi:serine/threonine-protein kinase RsbW